MPQRTISVPPIMWRAVPKSLYSGANVAMGIRMKDMTFDSTPARQSMNTTVLRPFRITRSSR